MNLTRNFYFLFFLALSATSLKSEPITPVEVIDHSAVIDLAQGKSTAINKFSSGTLVATEEQTAFIAAALELFSIEDASSLSEKTRGHFPDLDAKSRINLAAAYAYLTWVIGKNLNNDRFLSAGGDNRVFVLTLLAIFTKMGTVVASVSENHTDNDCCVQ